MGKSILGIPLRIETSSLKRPLQIVEHRQNPPKHFSFSPTGSGQNLSAHPLPEVLKISLRPLCEVQILVPLPLSVSEQCIEIFLDLLRSRGIRPPTRGWR